MASSPDDRDARNARYAGGAFGAPLGHGTRRALVMVDFAAAYFEPGSPLFADCEPVRAAAARLLAAARAGGVPVFHTRVAYSRGGREGGVFFRKIPALAVFEDGHPLARFAEGLEPEAGEAVIVKHHASAFFGTDLLARLRSAGIDAVVIAGVSTSGCVRASAVDAIQNDFIPLVVRDAVGDRHPAPHEANLFDLQAKYAEVIGLDEALALLRAPAGGA